MLWNTIIGAKSRMALHCDKLLIGWYVLCNGESMESQTNVKSLSRIDLEVMVMLQDRRIAELESAISILRNGAVLKAARENINDLRRLLMLPELAMGDVDVPLPTNRKAKA